MATINATLQSNTNTTRCDAILRWRPQVRAWCCSRYGNCIYFLFIMVSAGNTDSNKLNDIEVSINLLRKIFTCKIWHEFWENIFSSWINRNRQTQRFFGSKWSGKTSSFPIWIMYLLFRVRMHRISSWIVWFSFTVVIRWIFMVLLHIEYVLLFYFYIFFQPDSNRCERNGHRNWAPS